MEKKITKKDIMRWLENVAELKILPVYENLHMPTYVSKIDQSYIAGENHIMDLHWMVSAGITEQVQSGSESKSVSNIGFNPEEQKWYGWSHRAYAGFGIGSEVKLGNSAFQPSNSAEFLEKMMNFWEDEYMSDFSGKIITGEKNLPDGVRLVWKYKDDIPNESLRNEQGTRFFPFPEKWGRGEWKAETLEDAKQMAIDFAWSVS